MPPSLLILAFALTASLYAAAGFGGGSTYTALLTFTDMDHRALPILSLACNILVTAGGAWAFWRAGHVRIADAMPFALGAIPAAYIGGQIALPPQVFFLLLGLSLLLAGGRLLIAPPAAAQPDEEGQPDGEGNARQLMAPMPLALGAVIGVFSGLVGIGGGIFLSPILYLMHWAQPRRIAGICAIFILLSSLSGLLGRAMASDFAQNLNQAAPYWLLIPTVIIAGQLGARFSAYVIAPDLIKRFTGIIIIAAAIRLIWLAVATIHEQGGISP